MESLGNDLLLLMLNLSRMRDPEMMLRLFVEALAASVPGIDVRRLGPGANSAGEVIDVATPEATFGRIAVEDPGARLSDRDRGRFRNATRMLAVVLENVSRAERLATENARLDAAVAERTRELRRSLAEGEDLYQNAPCGYHSLDADAVYVRVNETELRWLGYERHEVVRTLRFTDLVAPESRRAFEHSFELLKRRGAFHDLELSLLRKDGTTLPALLSSTALVDASGRFIMSRGTMYDLSERRRAEVLLHDSEERFRQAQKLEAVGRLAGGIAHDFNNLLTAVLGCAEALHEGLDPTDPRRELSADILEAGNRAAALTRQLLAFGRRQPAKPVSLDLGEVVAGVEKMLRRLIGEDIVLEVVRAPALRRVLCDPGQMEQVLLNLAVNARDAMPQGGRLRIETANHDLLPGVRAAPGARVMLAVSDTGAGIPPEVQSRLFEPFFTTKAKGKGTGLGLATVYGIVTAAGGTIRVDSAPGHGARFEVLLPPTDDVTEAASPVRPPEALYRGRERVLLVDDDPFVRTVAARTLRDAGYSVIEATDGETALALAPPNERVDLVVTDVVMPRMGGMQLVSLLRESHLELRVVYMSGYAEGTLVSRELGAGTADFLEKPFSAVTLTRAVRQQLDRPAPAVSVPGCA